MLPSRELLRFALAAAGGFTRGRLAARIAAGPSGRQAGFQPSKQAAARRAARIRFAAYRFAACRLAGSRLAARRLARGRFAARITASLPGRTAGPQPSKQTKTGFAARIATGIAACRFTGGRLATGRLAAGGLATSTTKSAKKASLGVRRGYCEKHHTGDQCREDDTTLHGRYSL